MSIGCSAELQQNAWTQSVCRIHTFLRPELESANTDCTDASPSTCSTTSCVAAPATEVSIVIVWGWCELRAQPTAGALSNMGTRGVREGMRPVGHAPHETAHKIQHAAWQDVPNVCSLLCKQVTSHYDICTATDQAIQKRLHLQSGPQFGSWGGKQCCGRWTWRPQH